MTCEYVESDGVSPSESASNLIHTAHTLECVNGSSHYSRTELRPTLELSRPEWLSESSVLASVCSCPLFLGPIANLQIYWSVQLINVGK